MPRISQLVLMGVAGSGKTTLANELGRRLGCEVADADEFHPPANVAKMASGIPLEDEDRWPWLKAIAAWIGAREESGRTAVVTCSALKRAYRDVLRSASARLIFVHLSGTPALIADRLASRRGHFMPPALLDSQLAILEPLGPDEPGLTLDVAAPPADLAEQVIRSLGLAPASQPGSQG
ncbi:MAG TPA: gluconokinase [Anaeromyxobacter sp.]|nr:gluconokinase [Anaeromyxobacter sp.]